jgi:hypothetical protein
MAVTSARMIQPLTSSMAAAEIVNAPNPAPPRQEHAGGRDGERGSTTVRQVPEIEFEPDQKHQKNEAELAQDGEHLPYRRIEHALKCLGEEAAEYGRTEKEAGSDLSTHEWLPHPPEERAEHARRGDDHDQLNENDEQHVLGMCTEGRHRGLL